MMLFINCLFWLKNWRFSPNSRKGLLYPYFQWDKQFSLTANARKHFFLHFLFLVKNWIKTVLLTVSNVYLTERIYYTIGKGKGTRIFRVNLIWRFIALLKGPPATHVNLKTGVKRKQNTCVSRGSKCSCFGKFGVFFFLVTPVVRFASLPYYWRYIRSSLTLACELTSQIQSFIYDYFR